MSQLIQFLLLFLMFLFSFWQIHIGSSVLSVLLYSSCAFICFLLAAKKHLLFYLYFLFFFVPGCIHFVYQFLFHQPIDSASVEQIFISNIAIILAFLQTHILFYILIPVGIFFVVFLSRVIKKLPLYPKKSIRFLSTLMFIFLMTFCVFFSNKTIFQVISEGYTLYKDDCIFVTNAIDKKLNTSFSNIKVSQNQTIIIVIGESETRKMMSLYGYKKNTTPHLYEQKDDLIVFSDVFSPHSHTSTVLDKALTLKSFGAKTNNFGSVVDLFSQAGFEVYWLSTPPLRDKWSGSKVAVLSDAAYYKFFLNKGLSWSKYDIDLLPYVKQAIVAPSFKKLIIVHLLGSHSPYSDRYPKTLKRSKLTSYENSIYSTDYFMGKIISFLKKENIKNTKLLYFSDHGDAPQCHCHTEKLGYPEMFEVPFYLWLSPDIKNNLKLNKDTLEKPYNTEHLFHSIADLAEISADEIDIQKSIFNKDRKGGYVMLDDKKYAISSDLIFEASHPLTRGKVINFSENYLKIKWYSSNKIETWKKKNSIWKKI